MLEAMYVGVTGMQAQQLSVETVANNLANMNTVGYKKSRVAFADMVQAASARANLHGSAADANPIADGVKLGAGAGVAQIAKMFELGEMRQTGSAQDIAIQGDGFVEVVLADGGAAFSRGGTLRINKDGMLAHATGDVLKASISIPVDATSMTIDRSGRVLVALPNHDGPTEVGQIDLIRFTNPSGLEAMGDGLYRANERSGGAIEGRPGEEGLGFLSQGYLEGSNVRMVDEMVNLMVAQRAYEASAKVVQASDEMLGLINGLRR